MRAHPAGKLGEGATAVTGAELCERLFQSTPPARGATPSGNVLCLRLVVISIHAPREGGDKPYLSMISALDAFQSTPPRGGRLQDHGYVGAADGISIHAPREGGDSRTTPSSSPLTRFQPTPPARGATSAMASMSEPPIFQSTPPRGGRPNMGVAIPGRTISIHAPARGATWT